MNWFWLEIKFIWLIDSFSSSYSRALVVVSQNLQLLADLYQVLRSLQPLVDGLHQGVNTPAELSTAQTGQAGLQLWAEFLCWERQDLGLEIGRNIEPQVLARGSLLIRWLRVVVRSLQATVDLPQVEERGIPGQHCVVVPHTAAQPRTFNLNRNGDWVRGEA